MNRLSLTLPVFVLLAACGQDSGASSTTKVTNVKVVEGTISDDMILLDTSEGDGTATDQAASGDLYETIDNRSKAEAIDAPARAAPAAKAETVSPLEAAKASPVTEVKMVEPATPPE